ncbi:anti-sigma F factor [Clostridium hydrogenum]|uniref:anti-sigma F factor n=1 Tax=Clostridium hydrogenum TaxID=2855764 RepID=UPI001F1D4D1D|nr:anti-sigma F factor [Clostridium hydrogenum]
MSKNNRMNVKFLAKPENEGFARVTVAAFASQLDPTIEEIEDVKTAVSEAVTNSIIHGYENNEAGIVEISAAINRNELVLEIIDEGIGIADIEKAREPLYTSRPDLERSGMGFTIMESFMDTMEIKSEPKKGTKVVLRKRFTSVKE